MASLGKFGTRKPVEVVPDTTFDWFDVEIHLAAKRFSELEFVDLMERAGQVDENNPAAITLIKDMFRMLLADESTAGEDRKGFNTFWQLAKTNDQGIEDLMAVYSVLMEAQTNRPTQRPSDSSPGPLNTPQTSQPASSFTAASPGRPDLQVGRDAAAEERERLAMLSLVRG